MLSNNKLAHHYGNIDWGLNRIGEINGLHDLQVIKSIPFSMQINLLNLCFQKCIGCRKPEWPDVSLKHEEVRDLLLWLAGRKSENTVVFSGGDPFAYKGFERVVRMAHNFDLGIGILTAGLWPKSFDYETVCRQASWIAVSVDGASTEIYRKMRGVNTLKKIRENIALMVEHCPDVRINATIGKDNFHEMADIIRLAGELKVASCNLFPIHTWEELQIGNVEPHAVDREWCSACTEADNQKVLVTNIDQFPSLADRETANVCVMPLVHCFVDANGDVFVCCRAANDNGDHSERYTDAVIGNIRKNPIADILASDRARTVWEKTAKAPA